MKRLKVFLVSTVVVVLVATFAWVSFAKVETTQSGVYSRLLVPAGSGFIGFKAYSGTGENVVVPGFVDGPVVRRRADGGWSATWFCEDRVREARGNGDTLRFDCAGKPHDFALADVPVAPAVAPMPGNLAVLSDLEGNIRFLDAALARLGIVGDDGRWQYGNGHLVVLGDVVDRGRDVYAVLWRLHDLAGQAHAAGGALHLVLGNHEQYILRGNHSRAHPEHRHAMREMGGFERAFAGDTVIGAWLRAQPVALKLGRVLFVHGGVSPTLADAGLSVEALNSAMRDYWRAPPGAVARTPALDAVLGNTGVTQYRGFFEERKNAYPMAPQADVERVLAHFGADQVVVGHTLVERVERRYDDRVFAIDVNDDEARPEVLVYAQGVPAVIDIGESRALRTQPPLRLREFSLFDPVDRRLLGDMYRAYRELGRIAQPY